MSVLGTRVKTQYQTKLGIRVTANSESGNEIREETLSLDCEATEPFHNCRKFNFGFLSGKILETVILRDQWYLGKVSKCKVLRVVNAT
jgi:hypothetical protein